MSNTPEGVRLQKVLAKAGVASRRVAEELIELGRVQVDGVVVHEQGRRIDPDKAVVHVDGLRVVLQEEIVTVALNKPKGVLSTMHDDDHRPCVGDYLVHRKERLFHVGRLDADTEGLLLLTNDGELAHRLTHPSFGIQKTYLAEVSGTIAKDLGKRLRGGIQIDDRPAVVDSFKLVAASGGKSLVEIVIHEGRKHIVRRLLTEVGHPVLSLVRTAVGEVQLGQQRPGSMRVLNRQEAGSLYRAVGM